MWRIIVALVIIAGTITFMVSQFPGADRQTHEFTGEQSFSTLEDAQQFQTTVVDATKSAGGDVISFDLSVMSPPKVSYYLYVPNVTSFTYGKEVMSAKEAESNKGMAMGLIIILSFIIMVSVIDGEKSK
jgi:hypothetical protein